MAQRNFGAPSGLAVAGALPFRYTNVRLFSAALSSACYDDEGGPLNLMSPSASSSPASSDTPLVAFLTGTLFGLLVGGVAAILLAPSSGRTTRHRASAWAKELPDSVREDWENPYGKSRRFLQVQQARLEKQWDAVQLQQQSRRLAKAKQREEKEYGDYAW